MLGTSGVFDPEGGTGAGQISGRMRARPGPQFQAIRDAEESAKLADVVTAKEAAAAPATAVSEPAREQPARARPPRGVRAGAPAMPVAPAAEPYVAAPAPPTSRAPGTFKNLLNKGPNTKRVWCGWIRLKYPSGLERDVARKLP